ncbi:MAG: hypothetical protein R3D57_20475 [Hyphomicrobiaceae bacterium]
MRTVSARSSLLATAALLASAVPALAGEPSATEPDCFEQFLTGTEAEIACVFPTRMSAEELAEVRKVTKGLLWDARCEVQIRLPRKLIADALSASGDHVFEAPAQKSHCEVVTAKATLPVDMTFAPKVTFKDGLAIEATPNLGNVTGVPKVLWWPVAYWVNSSGMIEETTLKIVNAVKRRYGTEPAKAE